MDKKTALQYIVDQGKRVTAKQVSIDLDAPISTTTELLERMAAQGLLERDRDERPRQYAVSEEGRKRLEFFLHRDAQPSPISPSAPASQNPTPAIGGNPSERGPDLHGEFDKFREEISPKLDALREDFRDLLDVLAERHSSDASAQTEGGSLAGRAQRLLARAEKLSNPDDNAPLIAALYAKHRERHLAPWFRFTHRICDEQIANLEEKVGPQISDEMRQLCELEFGGETLDDEARKQVAKRKARFGLSDLGSLGKKIWQGLKGLFHSKKPDPKARELYELYRAKGTLPDFGRPSDDPQIVELERAIPAEDRAAIQHVLHLELLGDDLSASEKEELSQLRTHLGLDSER